MKTSTSPATSKVQSQRVMIANLRADLNRMWPAASPARKAWYLLVDPGTRSIFYMRCQLLAFDLGVTPMSRIISAKNQSRHGIDIVPGAQIGPGLIIRHPNGIVIGATTVVGADVTILQGVTLGQKDIAKSGAPNPTVHDGAVLGANAIILGNLRIGRNATIGAAAVVVQDVPENAVVVGNPGRQISKKNRE